MRAILIEGLPSGEPSQEDVARALHTSTRSLQRRLADEGTTFADILDRTRHSLATAYVGEGHYSMREVAYLLGFSRPASFVRAFRRWTGAAPTEYRAARPAAQGKARARRDTASFASGGSRLAKPKRA